MGRLAWLLGGAALLLVGTLLLESLVRGVGTMLCLLGVPGHEAEECATVVDSFCSPEVGVQPVVIVAMAGGLAAMKEWLQRRR